MISHYIASLPWYDSSAKREALDQFWCTAAQSLEDAGVEGVHCELTRDQPLATLWQLENLVLSQCCGPDLFTPDGVDLCVVARPVFAELDCQPGCYYSFIVSGRGYSSGPARIVVNSLSSRSGYSALIQWMDLQGIEVSAVHVSGSHSNSIAVLEEGLADLAAIDAHTVNQLDSELSLPIIGKSTEALSPPYVYNRTAALGGDLLFNALACAVVDNGESIGIADIIRSDNDCYREYFDPRSPCARS